MAELQTYTPNAKQQAFHADPAKYRLLLGAAGSGKTVALAWEDILLAQEFPGSTGVVFRKAYPQLRDTTQRTYLDECPPELIAHIVKSEGREEVRYTNGSRTLFRCLDDYRKLGSTAFDRVSVDEVIEVEEREFRTLVARLRGKVGPRRLMCATNPPDEDHYLYQFFEIERTPDKAVIHSSTYDNAANLPADYLRELERYPPAWRNKFLYGNWGFLADGKPVFAEYNEAEHVDALQPVAGVPIVRGWDFGFHHPACAWVQQTPTGHVHWLHELQGTDEELRRFAERVVDETARRFAAFAVEDYCDIAGTQKNDRGPTAVQVLRNEFGVFPNYRKLGLHQSIERIRYLLRTTAQGVPLLQIDTGCRLTRKAFAGGYAVNPKTDEPEKGTMYDNIMDAGRYAIVPLTAGVGEVAVPYAGQPLPASVRLAI